MKFSLFLSSSDDEASHHRVFILQYLSVFMCHRRSKFQTWMLNVENVNQMALLYSVSYHDLKGNQNSVYSSNEEMHLSRTSQFPVPFSLR